MKTCIQKWGNSLALRIPKIFADGIGLKENSSVKVSLDNGKIVISSLVKSPSLEQLLSRINKKTCTGKWILVLRWEGKCDALYHQRQSMKYWKNCVSYCYRVFAGFIKMKINTKIKKELKW